MIEAIGTAQPAQIDTAQAAEAETLAAEL